MRTQARTSRTATTGLAFTYIGSRVRPELYVEGFSRKDPSQARARQFAEYLRWAGRAQEIVWAEKELRAASTAHSILHNGSQKTSFLDPLLAQTGSGWYASFYYLTLGVIMLCLWAAVTFTARVSRLPRWLRYTAPGIVLVLLLTWLWHRRLLWLAVELKINAGYFADSNGYPSLGPVGEWIDYLRQKLWHWEADVDNLKPVCLARLGSLAFAVLSLITVISAPSMLRARPVGEAIVDGIRHAGLAVASALFLLYVPAALHTASAERRACEVLDHLTYREPQYYARLLGTTWPD